MSKENESAAKPRVVRVVSDETLEAWEAQRSAYLKEHPQAAITPVRDELVREALGLPEEHAEEKTEETKEKTEDAEKTGGLAKQEPAESEAGSEAGEETEVAEKALVEDERAEDEADAEEEKEETEENEEENEEEEARVEVEKPAAARKPKIKMITEPVVRPEAGEARQAKPRVIERMEEQASRDIWPAAPQPGAPITLEQASKEVRAEEARRLWLARQEEKGKSGGFFGKIKAAFGFH